MFSGLTNVQTIFNMQEVGFEPTQISLVELESTAVTTWLFLQHNRVPLDELIVRCLRR